MVTTYKLYVAKHITVQIRLIQILSQNIHIWVYLKHGSNETLLQMISHIITKKGVYMTCSILNNDAFPFSW